MKKKYNLLDFIDFGAFILWFFNALKLQPELYK